VQQARVRYRAYQSAAGNYIVLHNIGTNTDFVYMHLVRPAPVRVGQVVSAGQPVGNVGETGDASGCHLHFEYWVGPWYGGGHPIDPLPFLKQLDRKS
jgi:murein DD-endopeptidase MepM/ murein hydrolase activator NlpD